MSSRDEKKLQRCLDLEIAKKKIGFSALWQCLNLIEFMEEVVQQKRETTDQIVVFNTNTKVMTNFQEVLIRFGYKWHPSQNMNDPIRPRSSYKCIVFYPKDRTMIAIRLAQGVEPSDPWLSPDAVRVDQIMNLKADPSGPVKVAPPPQIKDEEIEELYNYIDHALQDRRTWIERREHQIKELLAVRMQVRECRSNRRLFRDLFTEAKRIRGTYGASQTNS